MKFGVNEQMGVSVEYAGDELEQAYVKKLGGTYNGGRNDEGADIIFAERPLGISMLQVKSSWLYAKKFLDIAKEKKEFIPVVIGDPGKHTDYEILSSVRDVGGWIGDDVNDFFPLTREEALQKIRDIRRKIADFRYGFITEAEYYKED